MSHHIGSGITVIMSIKPIKKGEEMFLCYGIPYWYKDDSWVPLCRRYQNLTMKFAKLQLIRMNVCKEKIKKTQKNFKETEETLKKFDSIFGISTITNNMGL